MDDTIGSLKVLFVVLAGASIMVLLVKYRAGASVADLLFRWKPDFGGAARQASSTYVEVKAGRAVRSVYGGALRNEIVGEDELRISSVIENELRTLSISRNLSSKKIVQPNDISANVSVKTMVKMLEDGPRDSDVASGRSQPRPRPRAAHYH